uniref:huntingtin-like n=1 Tax=Styela clava TaxID=7725 RepID=UPI0019399069|nr:huntingtin-like [Styela clava]XP_039263521.1 huntingtin-like [Styela clava]
MEKLVKSVNNIKQYYGGETTDANKKEQIPMPTKAERQECCKTMAESILSSPVKGNNEYSGLLGVTIEMLLLCCQDAEADVRIAAEESINRIIKGTEELHFGKVLIEFYKEIKRNGSSRSLRTALVRFSSLAHRIRPSKCRPYVVSLLPPFIKICERNDESIQECLSASVSKIFPLIGSFAAEAELQSFIDALMKNLSSPSAAIRRTSSICIYEVVSNSSKKQVMLFNIVSSILGSFSTKDFDVNFILGSLIILRYLIPLFASVGTKITRRTGSFGSDKDSKIDVVFDDIIVQIFELCVHFSCFKEANVVTASLETLQILLKLPSASLKELLEAKPIKETVFSKSLVTFLKSKGIKKQSSTNQDRDFDSSGTNASQTIETPVSENNTIEDAMTSVTEKLNEAGISSEDVSTQQNELPISTVQSNDAKPDAIINEPSSDITHEEADVEQNTGNFSEEIYFNNLKNLYCEADPIQMFVRILSERILKIGSESTKDVRVSAMNLTISCIGLIFKLRPKLMFMSVYDNRNCHVSEILSFKSFYDPQIRGCTVMAVSQYIASSLILSQNNYTSWLRENFKGNNRDDVSLEKLVDILSDGLKDESLVCLRASIQAVKTCIGYLLRSDFINLGVKLLGNILELKDTTYWLVKVDLMELLGNINFRQILFASESTQEIPKLEVFSILNRIYEEIVDMCFEYLGDRDVRVRKTSAAMLVKIVTNGGLVIDSLTCNMTTSEAAVICNSFSVSAGSPASIDPTQKGTVKNLLKIYRGYEKIDENSLISHNLSVIVGKLTSLLAGSISKPLTQGCIHALLTLSNEYSVSKHPVSYDCSFYNIQTVEANISETQQQHTGIITMLLTMLDSAWVPLEITTHANVLLLAGNYMSGIAYHSFQTIGPNPKLGEQEALIPIKGSTTTESPNALSSLSDHKIGILAVKLFNHILKLISIFHHVISDAVPSLPNKSVLQTLQNTPSLPNTLKKKDKIEVKDGNSTTEQKMHKKTGSAGKSPVLPEEAEKEKPSKQNSPFHFANSRLHMKVHDFLVGAYDSFKTTLDGDENDRFCILLQAVLDVFCQILEITTFEDIEKYTEDLLMYLRTIFTIEPTQTVQSVQQLLKSLFGTNLVSQLDLDDQIKLKPLPTHGKDQQHYKASFYHQVFHRPLNDLTMAIANASFHHYLQQENTQKASSGWFGSIKKKVEKKLTLTAKRSKGDKMSIQNYIRLFESIVIKSLKNYTMTSSVNLQKHVLNLLAQLVQLRVNYCLLDSDQIFIGFIIKQFESIEGGLVRNSDILIPHVFFFLVLLSYEKHHSKSVMTMPKIIQLCDGIMASGCDTVTHTIPALQPIVHDLFVLRAGMKHDNTSDLDTQREVTQSMLFRIIEYPEVLSMVTTILQYYRKENPEQWKKYSRQVTDVLLPLISHLKLVITKHSDMAYLHSLFEALSPTALRPIDLVLNIFFLLPSDLRTVAYHQRWIAKTVSLLRVLLCHLKEEYLLLRVKEMQIDPFMFSNQLLRSLKSIDEIHANDEKQASENGDNVLPPEEVIASTLLQIIGFTTERMVDELFNPVILFGQEKSYELLSQLFSEFLLTVTYIYRSGSFKRLTHSTRLLLSREDKNKNFYSTEELCVNFNLLSSKFPILTVLWSQLLTCIGYTDLTMWGELTGKSKQSRETAEYVPPLNTGMVQQGSIIMLADYICQNQSEVEIMSWLIVNHTREIISLQSEPPIQDFISAVHRSSPASGLFIESLKSLLSSGTKFRASFKKRVLFCLRGMHLNQSDSLLSLLLSEDWFVFSPILAISEFCDRLACGRVEMMLTQAHDSPRKEQLILHLKSLQPKFDKCESISRLGRLAALGKRLFAILVNGQDNASNKTTKIVASHQPQEVNKSWYKALVSSFTKGSHKSNHVVEAINVLDYEDILEIIRIESFNMNYLEECLRFAISEITRPDDAVARYSNDITSPLLNATLEVLIEYLESIMRQLPPTPITDFAKDFDKPTFVIDDQNYPALSAYWQKLFSVFEKRENRDLMILLCKAFTRCLIWRNIVGQPFQKLETLSENLLRLAVGCHELLICSILRGMKIEIDAQLVCLEFMQQVLQQKPEIQKQFYANDNLSYSLTIANCLNLLYEAYAGNIQVANKHFDDSKSPYRCLNNKSTPTFAVVKTCRLFDKISNSGLNIIPAVLNAPFKRAVQLVLCHPFFNNLAHVPQLLFKNDMNEKEIESLSHEPPGEYLQEKDMLKDYIGRINSLGWISRMQFEETWTSLLGVLVSQPIGDSSQNATPLDENAIQISCLTIRGLTALVMNTCMKPHGGKPAFGAFQNIPRVSSPVLPETKIGHDLHVIQCTIERALRDVIFGDQLHETFNFFQLATNYLKVAESSLVPNEVLKSRLYANPERREMKPLYYGIGQRSVKSFRMLHDISPLEEETSELSSDDENFGAVTSSDDLNSEASDVATEMNVITPSPPRVRVEQNSVDAHSCVQFLIDLFSEWFRSASAMSPQNQQSGNAPSFVMRLPRQFLCDCIHSLILVSDFFTERQQFEWMFTSLNSLQLVQPPEDDIMLQYLVLGMCKSGAVLGINKKICDILQGMMESALGSTLISCPTFALYGALYILECELKEYARPLVSLISKFVCDKFKNINSGVVFYSQQFLRNVVSIGFFLIKNWQDFLTPAHTKTFIQGAISILGSPQLNSVPNDVYVSILRSLETLITSYSLSGSDCDAIAKLAVDQFTASESSIRVLTSLNLTITCMYFRLMRVSEISSTEDETIESRLLSMERITLLFDKIKCGFPQESIVLIHVLPLLLDSFFSTQDMMNKVIGEFVSSLHPFPDLIATLLHHVFQILHSRGESAVVSEWVMLSLGNFTQRTPISTAIWCLTCIFVSASTNHWINSLLPIVLSEMHLPPSEANFEKFYISAKDFYTNQLSAELDRRSFHSIFKAVAQPDNPYHIMLELINKLDIDIT